jgi:hypothetical protein
MRARQIARKRARRARRASRRSGGLASLGPTDRPAQHHADSVAAKCPELNPQENIWQFMRDNWLSNRVFKSFDDIVDHCCDASNKLVDQPWKIMSIGKRDWPYGS